MSFRCDSCLRFEGEAHAPYCDWVTCGGMLPPKLSSVVRSHQCREYNDRPMGLPEEKTMKWEDEVSVASSYEVKTERKVAEIRSYGQAEWVATIYPKVGAEEAHLGSYRTKEAAILACEQALLNWRG